MTKQIENLPQIRNYLWRAMRLDDTAVLIHFEKACAAIDGGTHLLTEDDWRGRLADEGFTAVNSIIAINPEGNIAAAGYIHYDTQLDAVRAYLDGRVHPQYRGLGIGTALLTWLEERALAYMVETFDKPRHILRILFYDRASDAIALFEAFGYQFVYAEDEMRFDLTAVVVQRPSPANITLEPWTPANAPAFYHVYQGAFSTRTNNLMAEPAWTHHFANPDSDDFRPALSLLLKDGAEPAAFAVCHEEQAGEIWITQMGVRPSWRRQGFGKTLLTTALHRFQTAGFQHAMLSVNANNPGARKLYLTIGFQLTERFTVYEKTHNL